MAIKVGGTTVIDNNRNISNIVNLGTASALDVGTGANQIPQLDSNGKLAAIDGSALTGIEGFTYAATFKFAFGDY